MRTIELVMPEGELLERVKKEVNEDDRTRDQDLAAIKTWLKQQPHLPDEWDDTCLLCFLRGCKFSLEKTKRKLDKYFTLRTMCPEFFTDRDISRPELKDLIVKTENPTLPGLTPDGRRVTIFRGRDKSVQTDQLINLIKIVFMIADVRLKEELVGVASDIYILDASIVSATHVTTISPTTLMKFVICAQQGYPVRLNEIHIVNMSPLIDILFNIAKPFLSEKIKKRIFFHRDHTSLRQYIPENMLPPVLGGTGLPLADIFKAWEVKLLEYRDWFKEQESVKSNEALRPGKPKNFDEMFGIDGSFRQLSID